MDYIPVHHDDVGLAAAFKLLYNIIIPFHAC